MATAEAPSSLFEDFPDEEAKAEIVPAASDELRHHERVKLARKSSEDLAAERIKTLENSLFERSMTIVDAALSFADFDDLENVPQDWVEKYGMEEAERRFRIAKEARLPNKDAAAGLGMARAVAIGIARTRSMEKQGPKTLNVQFVQLTAPLPQFPEKELETE